jgi:hypothetical protein
VGLGLDMCVLLYHYLSDIGINTMLNL